MFFVMLWLLIGFAGIGMVVAGAYISSQFGIQWGLMLSMVGGIIMMIPTLQSTGIIKKFKLLPFFIELKNFEHISLFVNRRFQIWPLIMQTKNEGILHRKKLGIIEDKGSPLTWGDIPCSVSLQGLGVTVSLKMSQYTSKLEQNRNLIDYNAAVMAYLPPSKYVEYQKTRFFKNMKSDTHDIRDINQEIDFLLKSDPQDELSENVVGETVNFKNYLQYMKHAYDPKSAENALDAEILAIKQMERGYKQMDKAGAWAKYIVYILVAAGIFIIMISSVDFSKFLGH